MCNDYEQHVAWAEYQRLMQDIALEIPTQQNELDLRQADDIRIGDEGPVMRKSGEQVELASMRFGFPPTKPKAGPIFNFRSEGRSSPTARGAWFQLPHFSNSREANIRRQSIGSR